MEWILAIGSFIWMGYIFTIHMKNGIQGVKDKTVENEEEQPPSYSRIFLNYNY
jgi:hypothetical protein